MDSMLPENLVDSIHFVETKYEIPKIYRNQCSHHQADKLIDKLMDESISKVNQFDQCCPPLSPCELRFRGFFHSCWFEKNVLYCDWIVFQNPKESKDESVESCVTLSGFRYIHWRKEHFATEPFETVRCMVSALYSSYLSCLEALLDQRGVKIEQLKQDSKQTYWRWAFEQVDSR